ncbi:MAG: 50S ribosomal protein L11 methyltransferase [Flavobacteriaceae bacterium]
MDLNDTYIEIDFDVSPPAGRDILLALLSSHQFESFLETDTGLKAYVRQNNWKSINLEQLTNNMPSNFVVSHRIAEIPYENWNQKWESSFDPIVVGDYTVRAPFHPPKTTANELVIEPKMSFGTGHHQTTKLMMNTALEIDFENKRVLDMGCGTGILGILASHLGAKGIMAVDIEPWCVENTVENAKRNGCDHLLEACLGDIDVVAGTYDLIFANINRNTLLQHIPKYAQQLQNEGILLLSGFYVKDLEVITQKCEQNGLFLDAQTSLDDWVCLKFVYSNL